VIEFSVVCESREQSQMRTFWRAATMTAGEVSRPRRRFTQLSVRGLIVLVLIIGVWLGRLARTARVQSDAVTTIENTRVHVAYEWDVTDGHITLRGKPWAPTWLVNLIGIDYFGHVTQVNLTHTPAAIDAAMAPIGRLTRLRVLNLRNTPLSDEDLATFKRLSSLYYLDLQSTKVTDAGMVHIKGLPSLRVLSLRGTRVSDAGLVHLKGLTSLEVLIVGTQVTDAGVNGLKRALPSLRITR
jgi:internalin A